MRRKRLTSLKETDAFRQQTAWEPSKLSKSRPGGKVSDKTSGAQANTERLRRYLRKRQPTIGHNLSQLSSCRMSWLSIFHFRLPASQSTCAVLALPEPRRQLLPSHPAVARPMNCKSERIDATFCRRDLKPSLHHLPSCELPNNS